MFVIETTNVFLENVAQAQQSLSATLESTSTFTVKTMSNKADTSVDSTTATTQSKTSSKTTGVAKTSVTSNSKRLSIACSGQGKDVSPNVSRPPLWPMSVYDWD